MTKHTLSWRSLVGTAQEISAKLKSRKFFVSQMTMGSFFNNVWGKTLRDGDSYVFDVRRNPQSVICPVKGIEQYVELARELGVDLTKGYLFRPRTSNNGVQVLRLALQQRMRVLKYISSR